MLASLGISTTAYAGTITAQGNVTALDDVSQLQAIVGTATFNEGVQGQNMPLDTYAAQGATWHTGALSSILPGVTEPGSASAPLYFNNASYFPQPIAGGGVYEGVHTFFGGAVTFDQDITQVGLTASQNGTQYLTVWDQSGTMIGQVTWTPASDSAFIGIDTNGVPIGMVTYGNDNMWAGGSYGIGGSTIISDTWIWAAGIECEADADCDDGNECTTEVCVDNACEVTNADGETCTDDGNLCTDDVCAEGACTHPNNEAPCDDDEDVCTDDVCSEGECTHPFNEAPCEDGDLCTEGDVCSEGACVPGGDLDCNDENMCSTDSCDPAIGCVYEDIRGCCNVDEDCAEGEFCEDGMCEPIPADTEDDGTTDEGTTDEGTTDEGTTEESGEESGEDGTTEEGGDAGDEIGDDESAGTDVGDAGIDDDAGCNCSTDEGDEPKGGWLLALLGLGVFGLRRSSRRRAA